MTQHYNKPFDPDYRTPELGAFTVYHGVNPKTNQKVYLVMHRAPNILELPDGKKIVSDEKLGMPGGGLKDEHVEAYKAAEKSKDRVKQAAKGTIAEVQEELVFADGTPVLHDVEEYRYKLREYGQDGVTRWHGFSYRLNKFQMGRLIDYADRLNETVDGELTEEAKKLRDLLVHGSDIETLTFQVLTAKEIAALDLPFAYAHEESVMKKVIENIERRIPSREFTQAASQDVPVYQGPQPSA